MENNLVVLTADNVSFAANDDRKISGRVTDETGQTIVGASISVKGTSSRNHNRWKWKFYFIR